MRLSLRWYPKTTRLFSNTSDEMHMARVWSDWETTCAFSLSLFLPVMCQGRSEKQVLKARRRQKAFLKRGLRLPQFNVSMVGYDIREETARGGLTELLCRGGKGPEGVERWAESLCYLKLQQTLSSHFTPPVSEDSTTWDGLPGALQAENTDSITLRHAGRPLQYCILTERKTSEAEINLFNNWRVLEVSGPNLSRAID